MEGVRTFLWMTPCLVFQAWAADPPQPGQLANTMQATPLSVSGKFRADVIRSLGLQGFAGAAIGAGFGQATNTPGPWGQGADAFGKRFASALAGTMSRQTFAFVLESATHEDPRYFPSTEHSKKARFWWDLW